MAASLEQTILVLLEPNNAGLNEGFNTLKEAFKDPNIIVYLCECMTTTKLPEVRQYCCVLLRKKVAKAKQWKRIRDELKQGMKQTVLELFTKETEPSALAAVTELIAAIAAHELYQKKWPQLMLLLNHCMQSNNSQEKEAGLYAMSIITSVASHHLKAYLKELLCLFSKTLTDTSSLRVQFLTIICLSNLVSFIGTEEMNLLQNLVPLVIQVIRNLISVDEKQACQAMEIFESLIESEVAVLVPHIKPLIGFCLELAKNRDLDPSIRIKALHVISWLTKMKKKTILKLKLTIPILDVLFPIMCEKIPDGEEEDDDDESPGSVAGQVIDIMALHLPPDKLIPPLMHHMETALKSENPEHRKAAYLALAVIAEGCSEYIRNKCLYNYLNVICKGIQEENHTVKGAALYALGQFAEYLQPDISKYASELLPVLLDYLQQARELQNNDNETSTSLAKTFYALETFCENLEEELLPFLPLLMERLFLFLNVKSTSTKELCIAAIGSVATAAKENFSPYFPSVIEKLKIYISDNSNENLSLKIAAIDTLSQVARAVGTQVFLPMARDCILMGMTSIDEVSDPDLRRCVYNLFSAMSTVLKNDMNQYMNVIVDHMINSLISVEGINVNGSTEEESSFTLLDELDDDEDDDAKSEDIGDESDEQDDDEEISGFTVENAYMDEKESACCALKELSTNAGQAFLPHLDRSFNEVKKLIESPSYEVRREAICCLGQFCITINEAFHETGSLSYRLELEQKQNIFLPKLFTTAREDTERQVVLACLETLQEMLEKIKENFIFNNTLESIVVLIKDVFQHKLACQDDDEDEELDNQEAEYDSMLFEYAGDIIPSLVKTVPWTQCAPYFVGLLPFILSKTKPACPTSDKSFSIGTLAEVVAEMEPGASKPFLTHLLPTFIKGMSDENEEVRSNAVYGLGALVQNAGDALFDQYPTLLQALSNMLAHEEDSNAMDNLCSTVAKMIITNTSAVPLKEVFPAFLQRLPLKVDMDENIYIYRCLEHLYKLRSDVFFENSPAVLKILSEVLAKQKINEETKVLIVNLLKSMHQESPAAFETVCAALQEEHLCVLRAALTNG